MRGICQACNSEEDLESYRKNGKVYYRKFCKPCFYRHTVDVKTKSGSLRRGYDNRNEKARRERKSGDCPEKWILIDSKGTDRKSGALNDLDEQFVKHLISKPCFYCGETKLRMTLDRIDNTLGHERRNVNAACIRCNYLRRDIPYEAWKIIAVGVRAARWLGLFGDWTGKTWK